ncbi:MAG: YggT family protein [Acidimicrobiaceae bacterium]
MSIVCLLLQLYVYALIARVILSYFPVTPDSPVERINEVLRMVTEPLLGPLRRALPPVRFGGMGIDLSPMILILGIGLFVRPIIGC